MYVFQDFFSNKGFESFDKVQEKKGTTHMYAFVHTEWILEQTG